MSDEYNKKRAKLAIKRASEEVMEENKALLGRLASNNSAMTLEEYNKRAIIVENEKDIIKKLNSPPNLGGVKFDTGKPQLSLLTRESLVAEARAFEYGAKKYNKNNYKKGMKWSRVIDAAMRHLVAFNEKESVDEESGLCHLDHAKACLGMLVYYYEREVGEDDR